LTSSNRAASDSLDAPRTWLPFAAWLALLVGLAAAVSAWWGVSLRLEEYR
jgi:Na+/H+ antiporter NhaC